MTYCLLSLFLHIKLLKGDYSKRKCTHLVGLTIAGQNDYCNTITIGGSCCNIIVITLATLFA